MLKKNSFNFNSLKVFAVYWPLTVLASFCLRLFLIRIHGAVKNNCILLCNKTYFKTLLARVPLAQII